jgi:ADP-ribose pyrophosphatase YjhB (NUDIX family)
MTEAGEKVVWKYKIPDAVIVLPFTLDGKIIAISEFRPALGDEHVHLPGGSLREGEDPTAGAYRKLQEETCYVAGRARILTSLMEDSVHSDRLVHVAVAENCSLPEGSDACKTTSLFTFTPKDFWEKMKAYYRQPYPRHGGAHTLMAASFVFSELGLLKAE